MTFATGETVGPYRIMEKLGSGGMATVFKAYHAALDRYVAIKVLHQAFKADPQFFERFKREARIVANLEHSHIIPVYDFNEHEGEPYLVMRYIEGETLKARMNSDPLPAAEILHLMRPVCQALTYAHRQGILHRDIKPSNIMITRDNTVFLTDFGLARMVQAGETTLSQDMMIGTPQYISPEQAQGVVDLDGRTDVYSLGVVLYEMLTGRVPFNADTPFATVHDHIYTPLPLPSDINPKIDPAVERLLLKTLAKERDDRFADIASLQTALEDTLGKQSATSAVAAAPPPQRSGVPIWAWGLGATLIVCTVAMLLLGSLLLLRNRANNNPSQPAATAAQVEGTATPSAEALTEAGANALRNQRPARAIEQFEQAIVVAPEHLPAYFGLSTAHRQQGDDEASLAALQAATEQVPDSAAAWTRLGEAQLFNQRDPEAALESFTNAAALNEESATPHAGRAIALTMLGQEEEAQAAIDTALALEPDSPEARLAQAFYFREQGNRLAALRELRQIVQNQATSPLIRERARQLLQQTE